MTFPNPKKIYLFGSFARGEQNKDSDYDFYVIVDDNADANKLAVDAYGALWDCGRKRPTDILVRTEKNFRDKEKNFSSSVERDVVKEGIIIYER